MQQLTQSILSTHSFFLSLFWFLHIIIYVLPIQTPGVGTGLDLFLNTFFESTFQAPIVGLVFYGLFTFWLLLCVIKGTIKLGLRFAFITIHPMK